MQYGHSLLLSTDYQWDISLDKHGRINTCTGAYAIAQNAANAIKLFTNDAYFDPERGVPHFVVELGLQLQSSILRSRFKSAAQSVDGVASATVEDISVDKERVLNCHVKLYLLDGHEVDEDVVI